MEVKTSFNVRDFFECDTDDYAESVYQSIALSSAMNGDNRLHYCIAKMLYELLEVDEKDSGFATYCDETATQVMAGMYESFDEIQDELDDIQDNGIDPDCEYEEVPLEEADNVPLY